MSAPTLRLLSCSWPRPVVCEGGRWVSAPEWDAPSMPFAPSFAEHEIGGDVAQLIDWRDVFSGALRIHDAHRSGEMKAFHVVFRLRAERSGTLVFHDDDGCVIRRDGAIVHEDREIHSLQRHELTVTAGDTLDVAQWQAHGDWVWAGRIEPRPTSIDDDAELFAPFRGDVERALQRPNGPPLKTYFAASHPVRAALAIHSLVLNGYRPDGVLIYGDYQWSAEQRRAVEKLLPFATIVPTSEVVGMLGGLRAEAVSLARSVWSAMKIAVTLFHPPRAFCFLDDDVFILDRMDDALELFGDHDLVYQADWDHGGSYRSIWSTDGPLATGNVNTGVCFTRNRGDVRAQAARLVRNPPNGHPVWLWEQGFVATEFARKRTASLPTQRYFYPIFDGLPGGVLGYDWAANPCGFATTHFGGLQNKPTDDDCRALVRAILGRRRAMAGAE